QQHRVKYHNLVLQNIKKDEACYLVHFFISFRMLIMDSDIRSDLCSVIKSSTDCCTITLPSFINTMSLTISSSSLSRWDVMMISLPLFLSLMILFFRISEASGSSPAVGSSRIIILGSNIKASTALTFWVVPPDGMAILLS